LCAKFSQNFTLLKLVLPYKSCYIWKFDSYINKWHYIIQQKTIWNKWHANKKWQHCRSNPLQLDNTW